MEWVGFIWDLIILNPLVNVLVVMTEYLGGHFGLSIIILTIVINLLMYPLTKRQLKTSKAMSSLNAEIAEIKKKYAKDKQKVAEEQMRLMKEAGVSPAGCMLPMLVQMPVWIALYQSVIRLLALAPEGFLDLSQRLYPTWDSVFAQLPLNSHFLGLDLAIANPIMALLVGVAMWIQQKMTATPSTDPQQQAQAQMMNWMMPLMFGFICLSVPSGLAVYWFTSTAIRIILQYFTTGWGTLSFSIPFRGKGNSPDKSKKEPRLPKQKKTLTADDTSADIVIESSPAREEGKDDGESGSQRQDSRGSYSSSYQSIRRQSGGSRSKRNKRR
ncbi:MAG: membrane protein insertase YidC [Dehalococcoidales bacterium]|nr:membrane protein insertase YidC [Dehalococcoidales bacterium]